MGCTFLRDVLKGRAEDLDCTVVIFITLGVEDKSEIVYVFIHPLIR